MDENNMELVALLKLVQPSLGERDHALGNAKRLGKVLDFGPVEIYSESNTTVLALQHPERHFLLEQRMLDRPRSLGAECPRIHCLKILPFVQDFGDAQLSKRFKRPKIVLCPLLQVDMGHARHGIALLADCKLFLVL